MVENDQEDDKENLAFRWDCQVQNLQQKHPNESKMVENDQEDDQRKPGVQL